MSNKQPTRRSFLSAAASPLVIGSIASAAIQQIEALPISDLKRDLSAGRTSARALVEEYSNRIAAIDRAGPTLRSVIELNPDASKIADELDRERKDKGPRGPFHGIPVLIKDNIATADNMETTAGSLALVGAKPQADALLVTRLRQAGAIILGKTNLSEWANFRSSRSTSGWSARGGLTKNPYALDRNPSGSSSGSAVAVAANLCAVAVGTETDGSIISPSTACGIVGIKPTVGLISRSGIIPISHSQDTAGPMARCVADAAALLNILAAVDSEDAATASASDHAKQDFTKSLVANGLKGARIGVPRRFFGNHEAVDALMLASLEKMKSAGATLVDPLDFDAPTRIGQAEFTVMLYEFKAGLNTYLQKLTGAANVRSLKELIEFNEKNRTQELPYFGQETLIRAESKGDLSSKEYVEALEKCRRMSRTEGIDAVMDQHKLDAIVAPSGGPATVTDLVCGTRGMGGSSSAAAVAGYPNITVPMGHVFGLPVGVSFFGRAWSEPTLIRIAFAFEQVTMSRRAPRYLPTAELNP